MTPEQSNFQVLFRWFFSENGWKTQIHRQVFGIYTKDSPSRK